MSVRTNWTAVKVSPSHLPTQSPYSWKTNITTIKQLGAPGLEGDVWHVELEDAPHGITESAVKVFKANRYADRMFGPNQWLKQETLP